MIMVREIAETCGEKNKAGRGVFPPQVCRFCFSCPIATIVAGVSGDVPPRTSAKPIPEEEQQGVRDWLAKERAGIN